MNTTTRLECLLNFNDKLVMNRDDDIIPSTSREVRKGSDSGDVIRSRRGKIIKFPYEIKSNEPQNVGPTSFSEVNESDEKKDIVFYPKQVDDSEYLSFLLGNYVMSEPFMITQDGLMISPPEIEESPKNDVELPSENISSQRKLQVLSKTAETYELEKFSKNALLIFNQEDINGYTKRYGTEQDVAELEKTFSNFGFHVTTRKDFTKEQVMKELEEFCSQDFSDYGCVGVVVLTHGSSNGLLRAKDEQYSELEILNYLKVDKRPTLITKPKLVIIQACRGRGDIKGVNVTTAPQAKIRKDFDEEIEPYTLPAESDMLILHSSYDGKPSHRHEINGSWFIQTLCKKINQLWDTEDMESIMTAVKRELATEYFHEEYNKRTGELQISKQVPVTTSTLIRKLYLKPSVPMPQARILQTLLTIL